MTKHLARELRLDVPEVDRTDDPRVAAELLDAFVAAGTLDLPAPGSGQTAVRFEKLADLGELDLTVARLGEAHADAVAILAELRGEPLPPGATAGVWAAEPPGVRVSARRGSGDGWRLTGRKAWCSGAGLYSHALVTADAEDGPRLFLVDLSASGVNPADDRWPTPALVGTDTRSVMFEDVVATPVGPPGGYVGRPGFWHGAVGVAAVWYGGAVAVARALLRSQARRPLDDLGLMHLGGVDAALTAARETLRAAAEAFDQDPHDAGGRAASVARSARAVVEARATETLDRVGRALGAAPLALDRAHARRVADLQLYLRQSHADRDLAALGCLVLAVGDQW